ncbi:nickel ABC transporter ATP-binding protein NikE [Streptomyces sp. SID486]|uniref:nickel ABC transporter ATP-binding protein NikE n=1 Tax=Streptomyces sp. SID486 TaxID=2690264 RepID=UPI0013713D6E|nr:nickel ABC transporter ATP-binding protein NikE [Streptomyces sp. SID486]
MIDVRELTVRDAAGRAVLDAVSLAVAAGERVAVVGESGSGKTTLAHALLGAVHRGLHAAGGVVRLAGHDMFALDRSAARAVRRKTVSYLPQDPPAHLTPHLRVGAQIAETAVAGAEGDEVGHLLERVGLPADRAFRRRFPHQLSGGQQQRLALARALAPRPAVLILDEPTTGLDVLVQRRILDQIDGLVVDHGLTLLLITHDLTAAAHLADRLAVMRDGRIVEDTALSRAFEDPESAYTAELLRAAPTIDRALAATKSAVRQNPAGGEGPPGTPAPAAAEPVHEAGPGRTGAALLSVRDLRAGHGGQPVIADGISFDVAAGECLALLGLSGAGKTTLARCVTGRHRPHAGTVSLAGETLPALLKDRSREQLRRIQLIAQDASLSLNPRRTVQAAIARPLRRLQGMDRAAVAHEVPRLLSLVGLDDSVAARYPRQLSGGQRQRVTIARALAARPDVLLCDEVTASLDTRVQAAVLDLLDDLRARLGLALVFITHDLGVLARIADRVLVLADGRVCEQGPVARILTESRHEWTRALVEAAPTLTPRRGAVPPAVSSAPSPTNP